jgi:hypothetical protein
VRVSTIMTLPQSSAYHVLRVSHAKMDYLMSYMLAIGGISLSGKLRNALIPHKAVLGEGVTHSSVKKVQCLVIIRLYWTSL